MILVLVIAVDIISGVAVAGEKDKIADAGSDNAIELKACGPKTAEVNFSADTNKNDHPTPTPADGKAMVYVLRPTMMGNKVQTKLAVDGDWKGVNRGNTYFFFELAPGEHYVCSKAENHNVMTLNIEAGKTYYLQQHIAMGVLKARTSIEVMPDDEAKLKLAKLHLATWEKK